jgi:hypothetical protein
VWDVAWLAIAGAILGTFVTLVKIAIGTERRRADDWRETARTGAEANAVLSTNLEKLINSVDQLSQSQRETLTLLHTMAADRRGAA